MNLVVIYDSQFGNTAQVARAIGEAFDGLGEVTVERASEVKPGWLDDLGLLVVGAPTQKFRPTAPVNEFLKKLPAQVVRGVPVAAFDTRLDVKEVDNKVLTGFVKVFGYAAKPIADKLVKKGGKLLIPPEGFVVLDTEGPLRDGELKRAGEWAKGIREKL
jgi:flavodoxin